MDENISNSSERFKRLSLTSSKAQESDIMSIQLSQQFNKGNDFAITLFYLLTSI
jgi:hypothetical protein